MPISALLFAAVGLLGAAGDPPDAQGLEGLSALGTICTPTSVTFSGDIATVTAVKVGIGGGVVYRQGEGAWRLSPIPLRGPHSVARTPDGRWLINDTDHHRLLQVDDLSGAGLVTRSELAGLKLERPHDQVVDPQTGDIYVIDGGRRLFRFRSLEAPAEVWSFAYPKEMDYARALSWFDGKLHVIHSSRGEVWRIDDFASRAYTIFASPRPDAGPVKSATPYRDFPAGALSTTGLVLNDVEAFDGWYYGTNFFAAPYSAGGDPQPARLIRWRSWTEFEAGAWEDLSARLPPSATPVVPYFLTVHNQGLYVAYFDPGDICGPGSILRLEVGED